MRTIRKCLYITGTITSRKTLDYEIPELRSVRLFVDVTDGFCDAETYSVMMQITDVNEEPVITPEYVERTVYEGFVSVLLLFLSLLSLLLLLLLLKMIAIMTTPMSMTTTTTRTHT